jgi:hypothetical protein
MVAARRSGGTQPARRRRGAAVRWHGCAVAPGRDGAVAWRRGGVGARWPGGAGARAGGGSTVSDEREREREREREEEE